MRIYHRKKQNASFFLQIFSGASACTLAAVARLARPEDYTAALAVARCRFNFRFSHYEKLPAVVMVFSPTAAAGRV